MSLSDNILTFEMRLFSWNIALLSALLCQQTIARSFRLCLPSEITRSDALDFICRIAHLVLTPNKIYYPKREEHATESKSDSERECVKLIAFLSDLRRLFAIFGMISRHKQQPLPWCASAFSPCRVWRACVFIQFHFLLITLRRYKVISLCLITAQDDAAAHHHLRRTCQTNVSKQFHCLPKWLKSVIRCYLLLVSRSRAFSSFWKVKISNYTFHW